MKVFIFIMLLFTLADEANAATESMKEQSKSLLDSVGRFNLGK